MPCPSITYRILILNDYNYPGRNDQKLSTLFSTCAQTDYTADQVPDTAKTLWQNMQTMKNSETVIGPALADFSVKANIFYGYAPMKGTVGLWYDYSGTVEITNNSNSRDYLLLVQTHETIHGIQSATHTNADYLTWSLRDYQMRCLSNEAAAETGANLLALEMKLKGIDGPWNALKNESSSTASRLFLDYMNHLQAERMPYAQALAATGKTEFYAQFKDQWWLDFYNDRTLNSYISSMVDSALMRPTGGAFTLETARKTGYISPAFNFTAGLDSLPSPQACFGENTRMQQAYAYVEAERLGYTLGRQSPAYLIALAQLIRKDNPYLGVDLRLVKSACSKNGLGALATMDTFAKLLKKDAPAPAPQQLKP